MKDCIKTCFGANPKESPDFGKIGTECHVERLKNLIQTSGGEVLCGGVSEIDKSARYVPPTLIKGVSPDAPILKEEIFGPVLPILTFQDMDEAVEKANSIGDSALAMYIFSEDSANIEKALTQIESGGASVNTVFEQLTSELMPFGGKGASGYGKYHGKFGFDEFCHFRAVVRKSTLPGMRAAFAPLPVADKPVPDFVYTIAIKVTLGVLPGPVKRLMRQRTLRKMTKLALVAAAFWTFGPRIRECMEFVGA
jgi:aldehyde dehydrogenase (NAD+)